MWGLWWAKRHWGRFSPTTSVSPANHSTNVSIIIITQGWHNRPISGCSAECTQLDSTPLLYQFMAYGTIFWGNSPHSIHIFRLQKRAIRIITNCRSRNSCRELFKKLKMLPLISQYIFYLLLFVVKNREKFKFNSEIHSINTRYSHNFHYPICNLTVFQKGIRTENVT
jgi:hypothetical protein